VKQANLTPEQVAAAFRKVSLYINSAPTSAERNKRKRECFAALYTAIPQQLVDFATRLPDQSPPRSMSAWHVTYYYLATGMEGHADEEDHGVVMAATAEDAKRDVARRCSHGDPELESWYMSCLRADRYHG
jgi:hypothetical protein